MSSTSTRSTTSTRSITLPSAPVLIGVVYAVCVLGLLAVFTGAILFTDVDPYKDQGPVDSIISVGLVGTLALVIGVGLSLWLVRSPERAAVGAIVLAVLSVLSLVVFWSGAPGIFGACAAWLGGLTRGSRPQGGAARVAGIIGAFIAVLNIVLTIGGSVLGMITGS
jgi:hypothetical protein